MSKETITIKAVHKYADALNKHIHEHIDAHSDKYSPSELMMVIASLLCQEYVDILGDTAHLEKEDKERIFFETKADTTQKVIEARMKSSRNSGWSEYPVTGEN